MKQAIGLFDRTDYGSLTDFNMGGTKWWIPYGSSLQWLIYSCRSNDFYSGIYFVYSADSNAPIPEVAL